MTTHPARFLARQHAGPRSLADQAVVAVEEVTVISHGAPAPGSRRQQPGEQAWRPDRRREGSRAA